MKKIFGLIAVLLTLFLVSCKTSEINASSLVLTSDVVYVNVGADLLINVTVLPSDASNKTLEWVSDNQTIVTVTQEGVLSGITVGKTTVVIKVKTMPTVTTVITVYVVNQNWPSDQILAFAGFNLPIFTDFTFVEVEKTENIMTLNIKGTSNDRLAINAFKEEILALGWKIDGSFDNHAGRFKHDNYDFSVSMHNEFEDGGETIEFKIIKNDAISNEWPNDKILEKFGFELPQFDAFTTITVVNVLNGGMKIILNGFKDLNSSFHTFKNELEHLGWLANSSNNHHVGRFDKEGSSAYITYHEEHDGNSFEISIMPINISNSEE